MTAILVSAETETWQTEAADPDDEWSRDSSDGRVTNVWASILADWDEAQSYYWSSDSLAKEIGDVKDGDTIYAVVADYSTGDTFGRDGGQAQVLEVFTDHEEAKKFATIASEGQGSPWSKEYEYTFEYEGKEYRRAWAGYFEWLNSLDIWEVKVRSNYQNMFTPDEECAYGFKVGK